MSSLIDQGSVSLHLSDLTVVREADTKYARAVLYEHPVLGRVLALNGEVQHVEKWAPLYHEPLVHLPISFIEAPRSVLLLGGGSLFAAQELLRYRSIKRLLMLDRDRELVNLMVDTYQHAKVVTADSRLEIRNIEAFGALGDLKESFDLVVNDSVDLLKTSEDSFSSMARCLTPTGLCSDVIYRHVLETENVRASIAAVSKFDRTIALIFVPEYPGVLHALLIWGKSAALNQSASTTLNREQRSWAENPETNPCQYYDPRFLRYYLHLPRTLREDVAAMELTEMRP